MIYTTRYFTMRARFERRSTLSAPFSYVFRITKDDKVNQDTIVATSVDRRYITFAVDAQAWPMVETGQYTCEVLCNGFRIFVDRVVLQDTYTYYSTPTLSLPSTTYA